MNFRHLILAAATGKKVWTDPTDITADNFVLPAGAVDGQMDTVVKARTLKNELNYTPSTWTEWTKVGAVGDATGLEITSDGASVIAATLSTAVKANTKYGVLLNVVNNNLTTGLFYNTYLTGSTVKIVRADETGNVKATLTTQASITTNALRLYINGAGITSGLKIKIRDIRLFELPTDSEIESDFDTLTADQLAVKYPYIQGGETRGTGAVTIMSCGKNLLDPALLVLGGIIGGTGADWSTNTRIRSPYIPITAASIYVQSLAGSAFIFNGYHIYSPSRVWIMGTSMLPEPSYTSGAGFVRLNWKKADSTTFTAEDQAALRQANLQLELGSTATAYEPYKYSKAALPAVGKRIGEVYDEINIPEGLHIQRINGDAVLETPITTPISIPIETNGIADSVLRAWKNGTVSVEYEGALPTISYKYPLQFENLIVNGDFKNGTTGWNTTNGGEIDNGRLKFFSTSTSYATQTGVNIPTNSKVYIRYSRQLDRYVSGRTCVSLRLGPVEAAYVSDTTLGTKYVSEIVATGGAVDNVWIGNMITGNADSYFDTIAIIDLTALFGAGKEPSLAWCNANIAPNIIY